MELTGKEILELIVEMHEQRRPTKWIARSLKKTPREIASVLRVAGLKPRDVHDLEKYDRMEHLIIDGASHSEICRTLKCDYKTVSRWFPGTAWSAGGWRDEGGLIREMNRQYREWERTGKIQSNRDSGFSLRRDVV